MKNLSDVINQLQSNHLRIENPIIDGNIHRCSTDLDKKKDRGWYVLFEMKCDNGDELITGAYGYWQGNENNTLNVDLRGIEISKDDQKLIKTKMADARKQQEAETKARQEKAASECEIIWNNAKPIGENDYFQAKQIKEYGLRFTDEGAALIPMCDVAGRIRSLQYIYDSQSDFVKTKKRNKDFHYGGGKKGFHHLIGGIPTTVLLIAEGYATAATLHEATGLPVAVCFDAGNIAPVVEAFRKRYWHKINILICADDDSITNCMECKAVINLSDHQTTCPSCGKAHKRVNSGVKSSNDAAFLHNAAVVLPQFPDKLARFNAFLADKTKFTDFNDLALLHGLHTVRTQIDIFLEQKKWKTATEIQSYNPSEMLKPINTVDELVNRYSLVYPLDKMVFDHYESLLVPAQSMRDVVMGRDVFKLWQEHPQKRILREKNLGFDPTGKDKNIMANLFTGFETVPKQGKCENLLDLLHHLCGGMTPEGVENYRWILKWIAYPLQNQGAKMKTAVVIHGGQGVGKNLFFEIIKDIYGKYGGIIGQSELESPYNQWASHKLFLVADEIATQQEKYQVKNKLKSMITGDWINIRPLYMNSYSERNHLNMVFLSNDRVPVILEQDDRRHMVVWVKEKPDADFFADIYAEIKNGGMEALYFHLLYNVDCTGFDEHTKPLLNNDKLKLVDLCLDNVTLFSRDWQNGEIKSCDFVPAPSELVYQLYKAWCLKHGVRPAPLNKFVDRLVHSCDFESFRDNVMDGMALSKNPIRCLRHVGMLRMPEGKTQSWWLGEGVTQIKQAINAMADFSGGYNHD